MPLNKQFKIIDTLHESSHTVVQRAIRRKDKKTVILKILKPSARDEHTITKFVTEQRALDLLHSKNIIKLLGVISTATYYVHVLEDINGDSLYEILLKNKLSLQDSLSLALDLLKALEVIHHNNFIHADINPKNIIFNPQTGAVKLIDFGHCLPSGKPEQHTGMSAVSSASLLYMSPEQTGLTEGSMDLRSDLYSFGMSLYHLFLGRMPFDSTDRYELAHQQVAFNPEPLHTLDKGIPVVLSKIVQKLIHKNPKERYQSDEAVLYDIKKAIKHLDASSQISDFEIATHNYLQPNIGPRLFGRDHEIKLLKEISKKLKNSAVTMLISGRSGVGKTRLVEEFFNHTLPLNPLILRGSFDQRQEHLPYRAFKQIVSQLYTLLMSQQNHDLSSISSSAVSTLTFIFPELKDLFPSRMNKSSNSTENINVRLSKALNELFKSIATQERPLIIFMDDLQWADPLSVELINNAIIQPHNRHVHFITAYRESKIEANKAGHSLVKTLKKAAVRQLSNKEDTCVFEITLQPLTPKSLEEMFITLFSCKSKRIKELSGLVHLKTNGNPFYIKTLLNALIDSGKLYYKDGKWDYSTEEIRTYNASVNIAKLISSKYKGLAQDHKRYLRYLSILGNNFNLNHTLDMMHSLGFDNEILQEVQNDGFIYTNMHQYHFAHDQVQHNIYDSIQPEEQRKIHLKIGKYLQHAYEDKSYTDAISFVEHLNAAYADKKSLPKYLFKLNLIALEEMLSNNIYPLALKKLRWIEKHLYDDKLCESARALAFKFKTLAVKTLYLNAQHEEATLEIERLIKKTHSTKERLLCFGLYKNICVTQGSNFTALIQFGNVLFEELGFETPKDGHQLKDSIDQLQHMITGHELFAHPEKIYHQTKLHTGKEKSISALLMDFWEVAFYLSDSSLMQWAYLNIVHTSFKHGNTSKSSFGYVLYGAQLISQKEYKKAQLFGQVSLKLNQSFNDPTMLPKINNFVANFILPYSRPLISNIELYQKSLHQSKINGDIIFGTWANFLMHFSYYLSGHPLEEVNEKITLESDFIKNSGDLKMIAIFDVLVKNIEQMQGIDTSSKMFDEKSALELWEKNDFQPALAWFSIIQAQECFLKASYTEGLAYLQKYVHTTSNEVIMFPKLRLHFIRALLLLGKVLPLDEKETQTLRLDLDEFKSYAQVSPVNFRFERLLLQAEQMKSTDSAWDVIKVYDKALEEAKKLNNPFYLSLAALCASRFWKSLNYKDLSSFYFNEAIVGLNQWGAFSIVKHLKSSDFAQDILIPTRSQDYSNSSSTLTQGNFQSLLNAFGKISKAQTPQELIHDLMQIILQNATASKAVLLLEENNEFLVCASTDFQTQQINTHRINIEKSESIPKNIISYTINTGEVVNLQKPSESGKFQFDPYIQDNKPESCLCLPTFLEGEIKGVLYLENKDIHTPLDKQTLETLELLLSQALIVYKNTSLYETIKTSEEKLNKAQEISHVGSWQYNPRTQKLKWSDETYRIYGLKPLSQEIDVQWVLDHLHPDEHEHVLHAIQKSLDTMLPYDVIHRIILPEATEKIVHQKAEVLIENDGRILSGTIQDITQSEKAKNEISRFSQVVNQNPFSTLITDTDGNIIYTNKKVFEMTGYTHRELMNKKMNIFRSNTHSKEFYQEMWKTIKEEKRIWRGTLINKMKNGELLDCESTIFPLFDERHNITNFVTIQEDMTQRNIKDKIFFMQTRQAQMGEMLSMIAHQWRQPLAVMTALMNKQRVDILLDQANLDDILQSYEKLEAQIKHLSHTINDFRDFFRTSKKPVQTKSSTIISKAFSLVEHAYKQNNINVDFNYREDESYTTFEREMEQVLLNLFNNAQDALQERQIENPHLSVTCDHEDEYAIIHIEDNAQGIRPDVIDTLFLPYVSTKNQKHGTGLGLYMSKTIVEDHCKGSLDVQNTEHGARFTIKIPLKDRNGS